MSKNSKKIIGVIIILALILALIWIVYESVKPETVSISASNELPNENMGLDNIINNIFENTVTNTVSENEIINEVNQNVVEDETETEVSNDHSEVVSGTNTSREERAIELAKEYYEEEYGDISEIYFSCEEIYNDGRYIIRAGSAGSGINMFLFVDLDTEIVTEK